jgi:hypothetical protein
MVMDILFELFLVFPLAAIFAENFDAKKVLISSNTGGQGFY